MSYSLVMKFGGASLSKISSIHLTAAQVKEKLKENKKIVIVVSAMGKMTDRLLKISEKICPNPPKREQDMLISVGERISMSLLSMALHRIGVPSISFTGSQSGIITSNDHLDAQIIDVKPLRILKALTDYDVVIVAGFQGVSLDKEITTLGRGGSDTSAVALASALSIPVVEFYKDVEGIYSEDPKVNAAAIVNKELTYDEALKIIDNNLIKVLHPRAVKLAKQCGIVLKIHSYKNPSISGTIVDDKTLVDKKSDTFESCIC